MKLYDLLAFGSNAIVLGAAALQIGLLTEYLFIVLNRLQFSYLAKILFLFLEKDDYIFIPK